MRTMQVITLLAVCSSSSAAMADTITNLASYNGSADSGALLTGPLFDPSEGMLTGVSLAITGTYNPDILFPLSQTNIPTESQLEYTIFGHGGSFGTYDLKLTTRGSGQTLAGAAETFAIKVDPTDLKEFTSLGSGNHNGALGYINLFSAAANGVWGGGFSDLSLYSGDVTITYTYAALPEPSALALSATGLLLLAFTRVRRCRV